MPEIPV